MNYLYINIFQKHHIHHTEIYKYTYIQHTYYFVYSDIQHIEYNKYTDIHIYGMVCKQQHTYIQDTAHIKPIYISDIHALRHLHFRTGTPPPHSDAHLQTDLTHPPEKHPTTSKRQTKPSPANTKFSRRKHGKEQKQELPTRRKEKQILKTRKNRILRRKNNPQQPNYRKTTKKGAKRKIKAFLRAKTEQKHIGKVKNAPKTQIFRPKGTKYAQKQYHIYKVLRIAMVYQNNRKPHVSASPIPSSPPAKRKTPLQKNLNIPKRTSPLPQNMKREMQRKNDETETNKNTNTAHSTYI